MITSTWAGAVCLIAGRRFGLWGQRASRSHQHQEMGRGLAAHRVCRSNRRAVKVGVREEAKDGAGAAAAGAVVAGAVSVASVLREASVQ